MLTKTLITALDRAENPRAVSAATWALEKWTGFKTNLLVSEMKGTSQFGAADYYQREGFYKLAQLKGGNASYTGKAINWDSALDFSGVYACVKIISEDMAGLPLFLYERSKIGESTEKAYQNSLYRVLHDSPNPEMCSGEFREAMTARYLLGMDAFARVERSKVTENVIALYPLIEQTVMMDRSDKGQLVFVVKDGNEQGKTYTAAQILHLKGFTLTGQKTDDLIRRARNAIGIGLSADEYAGRFFANDAGSGVTIEFPAGAPVLSREKVQEIKDAWKKWHQGVSKSHEPAVLQDGAKVSRQEPDHQKLQMSESRRWQIIESARYYRMPLHKLADLDRATNNNIEHQGLDYSQNTLGPHRRRWEEAIHRCLLTNDEKYWPNNRPRMYAEFSVEAMVRGDFATQSAGFASGLQNGYYTQNEVRGFLNMNPVEGGDVPHIQLNMQTLAAAAREMVDQQTAPLKGQIKDLENKLGGMSAALRG